MPKIGNFVSSSEILCERCQSKRKIAKTWVEEIKNDHGSMFLTHTEIVCTNPECQAAFDSRLKEDIDKRQKLNQSKLENAEKREKAKAAIKASKSV